MFEFPKDGVLQPSRMPTLEETLDKTSKSEQGTLAIGSKQHIVSQIGNKDEIFDGELQIGPQPHLPQQQAAQPETINDTHTAATVLGSMQLDTSKPLSAKLGRILSAPLAFFRGLGVGGAKGAAGGAAAGAVGGAIAGAAGGTVVLPLLGTVAGAGAGAGAGALGGAIVGFAGKGGYDAGKGFWNEARKGGLASTLFSSGKRPQDAHGRSAVASLVHSGWKPSPEEQNNLSQVSAGDWKKLLHVPKQYKYTPKWASRGVKGRENRQKIREAMVLFVAKHGPAQAPAYRKRLIQFAQHSPQALHRETTRLKSGVVVDRLKNIYDTLRGDAQVAALSQLIRGNPELFTRPSQLHRIESYVGKAEHFGLESALGIVDRLQARGTVTADDNRDLNRAMNASGLRDDAAFNGDKADLKNLLNNHIGKPFTPELKHQVAQAIYRQFVDADGTHALNLTGRDRNELQSKFDPTTFQKRLNTNQISGNRNEGLAGQPAFDEVPPQDRAQFANMEIQALEQISRQNLSSYKDQVIPDVGNSLRGVQDSFETPQQQRQRIQQERLASSSRVRKSSTEQDQDRERLIGLRNQYAPGSGGDENGDDFERLKKALGLKDHEFDPEKLGSNITSQLCNAFGSYGDKLPPRSQNDRTRRMAEDATLNAISGHLGTAKMLGKSKIDDERLDVLQQLAQQYQKEGLPASNDSNVLLE
ncbi:MAG: hypothetical protein GY701_18240 [Sulfitobacter sp.]|nr:hypothetical protein [Sulfitobacter sp.]